MIFTETILKDAFIIEPEKIEDSRGFFARAWDNEKFKEHDLNSKLVQCNISFNKKKGTLRGMHFQKKPYEEDKLVRCTRGKIFDVIVDLRRESKTFKMWIGIELSCDNNKMVYVPKGLAHGYLSLEDNTEVFYQVSQYYHKDFEDGIRYDDETFKIKWPFKPRIISEKDLLHKKFIDEQ